MITSKVYQDYVVFVDCKSLRGRSKAEPSAGGRCEIDFPQESPKGAGAGRRKHQYLRQVRKLAARHADRSLEQLSERSLPSIGCNY